MPSHSQRGAALFVVLAFAALLASLLGAIMRTGVSGARAAAAFADAERADELGRGAGDIVAFRLSSGELDAIRGGRLSVHLADADVAVEYLSESARIDVNTAPVALIAAVLSAAGADQPVVDAVSAKITLLRKAGTRGQQPAAAAFGQSQAAPAPTVSTPSFGPPAIQSTLDIARAWDLPEDLARRVLPALTTASGSAKVDPIIAGRLVILALLGGDETRADDYMERRMQGFANTGSALALLPVPSWKLAGFADVAAVRAVARVTIAKRFERSYEMIVDATQNQGQPPAVVSWRKLQ